jgi:hypothetical protein
MAGLAGVVAATTLPLAALALMVAPPAPATDASSHREAPMISQDPAADATDFYAFTSPEGNGTVTFVAAYSPMAQPNGGPNWYRFGDDVLYAIKVDNNGDNKADITYEFRFKTTVRNGKTFLYNTGPIKSLDDPNLNVSQSYTVTRVDGSGRKELATSVPVPPANIGPKSTPDYPALAAAAIKPLSGGGQVFAGPRDDPFFVDLGPTFDLLSIRKAFGNMGGGVDGLAGQNVMAIVLQVPVTQVTADGQAPTGLGSSNAVVGSWTTASRQKTKVLSAGTSESSGDWIQVSRLGNPLVNEAVIPLAIKDAFNALDPSQDVAAGALPLVQDPEVSRLLNALYGVKVPPTPRDDLVAVFLTGIPGSVLGLPGATAPMNVPSGSSTGSEMLRLNLATPPTKIGAGNRLAALAGDVLGFPNGRRLEDDVVDIALRALAGATYPLVHKDFTPDPAASVLGDGVDANDVPFLASFPYLATPHRGTDYYTDDITTPFGFIRCGSGRIYRINGDGTPGAYVGDPAVIGNAPVLQASASVTADQIKAICGNL